MIYVGRLKSFEPQHENGITRQNHSSTTIVHALKACENCSHSGCSVVWQSFVPINVSVFVKMEKIEYRAIIKFLHLKSNTLAQIKAELDAVYGDSAPSFATVKRWAAEFKCGRISLTDDERSGRPTTAIITDNIEKVHKWYWTSVESRLER